MSTGRADASDGARRAIGNIADCLAKSTSARVNPKERPSSLYHYTDAAGLVGIVSSGKMRASHATACNDASETVYARDTARAVLGSPGAGSTEFREIVAELVARPELLPSLVLKLEPYIVSFCEDVESSAQWLNYGRSGRGFAIKFDTTKIQSKPFDLVQVMYQPEAQESFIENLVREAVECLERELAAIPASDHDLMIGTAAHAVAQYLRSAAPHLKHSAFTNEAEWRLITYETKHPAVAHLPPLPVLFRASGSRIVPYVEMELDLRAITDIVVGHSNPMLVDEEALRVLWLEHLHGDPSLIRSSIQVRE